MSLESLQDHPVSHYFGLLRPRQWIKNVLLFAAAAFAKTLTDPAVLLMVLLGFGVFCMLSSSVYVFNDILDRNEDRLHPTKRNRPIASGRVSVRAAVVLAGLLMAAALAGATLLAPLFGVIAFAYVVLQVFYSLILKHKPIIDAICIAMGFVLRAVAGAVLIHVSITPWLIVCTFTLCMFLGFGKRRCEIAMMGGVNSAVAHRRVLAAYTPDLLNHLITVSAGIAIISFLLYTMDPRTIARLGTNYLIYTTPLVAYGIFRYTMLAERGEAAGPTEILLADRPLQVTILLWCVAAGAVIYKGPAIQKLLDWLRHW